MFSYGTYDEVKDRIPYFIEEIYNKKDCIFHLAICLL